MRQEEDAMTPTRLGFVGRVNKGKSFLASVLWAAAVGLSPEEYLRRRGNDIARVQSGHSTFVPFRGRATPGAKEITVTLLHHQGEASREEKLPWTPDSIDLILARRAPYTEVVVEGPTSGPAMEFGDYPGERDEKGRPLLETAKWIERDQPDLVAIVDEPGVPERAISAPAVQHYFKDYPRNASSPITLVISKPDTVGHDASLTNSADDMVDLVESLGSPPIRLVSPPWWIAGRPAHAGAIETRWEGLARAIESRNPEVAAAFRAFPSSPDGGVSSFLRELQAKAARGEFYRQVHADSRAIAQVKRGREELLESGRGVFRENGHPGAYLLESAKSHHQTREVDPPPPPPWRGEIDLEDTARLRRLCNDWAARAAGGRAEWARPLGSAMFLSLHNAHGDFRQAMRGVAGLLRDLPENEDWCMKYLTPPHQVVRSTGLEAGPAFDLAVAAIRHHRAEIPEAAFVCTLEATPLQSRWVAAASLAGPGPLGQWLARHQEQKSQEGTLPALEAGLKEAIRQLGS